MTTFELFRPAAPASPARHLVKTLFQCTVIWTVFLALIPALLVGVEARLAIVRFSIPGQTVLGLALLAAFSALNLWTGAVLSRHGEGTPLPIDCPRRLVVTGPYAYVRNPMAIAGLGQGMSVVILLGSWLGIAYVAAGILAWQYTARPAEERDLLARFGGEYEEYRESVRLWLPRAGRYRPTSPPDRA